ncbi:MAG TPA: hypothetical protein VGM26_01555 [Rhizomicrobium sp.]|jgi:hypothetical protein
MIPSPPHLEVYYAPSCAPCRLELPVISGALTAGKAIRILIVDDLVQANAQLVAVSPRLLQTAQMAQGQDARDRLHRAGDGDGILPFTRVIGGKDQVCATWHGELTSWRIEALLTHCH